MILCALLFHGVVDPKITSAQVAKPYEVYLADVSAGGLPDGRTFGHTVTCTNLDKNGSSQITTVVYRSDGSVWLSNDYTITVASKLNLGGNYNGYDSATNTFRTMTMVVRSERSIACSIKSRIGGNGYESIAMISAAYPSTVIPGSNSTFLAAPQIMKRRGGTWNTRMVVQNVKPTAVTVSITYKGQDGTSYSGANETVTIQGRASYAFNPVNNAGLPDGFLGGATVVPSVPSSIVGFVEMYNNGVSYSSGQLQGYNLVTINENIAGAPVQLPVFRRNYYGFTSGFSVYNAGFLDQVFRATFTFNGVNYVQDSPQIPPGGVWALYAANIAAINPVDSLPESQRTGSVVMTSILNNQRFVVIVNEDNRGNCNSASCSAIPESWKGSGSTYNGDFVTTPGQLGGPFPGGTSSYHIVFTDVPRDESGWQGGFQLKNPNSSTANCSIVYAGQTTESVSIPPNGTLVRFLPNVANLTNSFGGLIRVFCPVSLPNPVVGIANVNNRTTAFRGDGFYSFSPVPEAPYQP